MNPKSESWLFHPSHFKFANLGRLKICYQELGKGDRPLLLLHTFRTQIEHSQRVIPLLSKHFRILVIDLPGHGRSSKHGNGKLDCEFFLDAVQKFIEHLDLKDLTIAGESIGGTLALCLAAKMPKRIQSVFTYNPYDYPTSVIGGFLGRQVVLISKFTTLAIHLGFSPVLRLIFTAGFHDSKHIPQGYMKLLASVPTKDQGFAKGLQSIIIESASWSATAENLYPKIGGDFPVHVVYGDCDWGPHNSEEKNRLRLKGRAIFHSLENTGHFSFLDNPQGVANILLSDANSE